MRRLGHRGKVDDTQKAIVAALRKAGALVRSTAAIGEGFPDLIVLYRGRLMLMECKVPGQKLRPNQVEFALRWPVFVVESATEALRAVGAVE